MIRTNCTLLQRSVIGSRPILLNLRVPRRISVSTTLNPINLHNLNERFYHATITTNLRSGSRLYSDKSNMSTSGTEVPQEVIDMTITEYHNKADFFLDNLLEKLEILSDDYPTIFPDVELNHGVMTLQVDELGPYVINKQPPNKQIWLASPISGPDRFDCIQGKWVSLRNKVSLTEVLTKELNIVFPEGVVDLETE